MRIGFVGLGKMGQNMTKRLLEQHEVVVFDINKEALEEAKKNGAIAASSIKELISEMQDPKIVWMMVPAGKITDQTIEAISNNLTERDILIDGGNSFYKDSIRHADNLKKKKIKFLDIGTSGGVWGLKEGYCLMVGGDEIAFKQIEPILKTLSNNDSYNHMGKSGSGHFVKMVHNGIEYALMQAYAEGFELLKAKKDFDLDLHKISKLWNNSSVVRSWLLELIENIFKKDQTLNNIKGFVEDSGEGRWTVKEAIDLGVPTPVINQSLMERFSSRQVDAFQDKILASLRDAFGGHGVNKGE
ncbi:MAG: 6-phosphogluconate dehydrogenase, NAD(+)-dependent, decarboxylating [Candidatus Anoxychlamydiales bacterium]|nr:6-phosphogluconate dehydrogenase, NAD(+)-dependent, decarboxylating [Candidatus Anoxychlamydiales bacterium]NGX36745.1 6-phosphogluconate dehydrogenase, NAD(+)-dependent, decarboxylating [Candidatus Anoxychlamydiales bacterium]